MRLRTAKLPLLSDAAVFVLPHFEFLSAANAICAYMLK
jgi:hypothetical protein